MIILKKRNAADHWAVYHQSLGNTKSAYLSLGNAPDTNISFWNNTTPTSSVFTVGTDNMMNASNTYVAYCFAEVEGYSKFGSYIGNGSTNGPFVYLGFRPAFLMLKNTNTANSWRMWVDDGDGNVEKNGVYPDSSSAEDTPTNWYVDWLSNGFKIRASQGEANGSGNTFIYMAFAEQPFKYANAK